VDIHLSRGEESIKFMRRNWGLAGRAPIRDRKFENGVDLAKERA
jgi:hypothetical protein